MSRQPTQRECLVFDLQYYKDKYRGADHLKNENYESILLVRRCADVLTVVIDFIINLIKRKNRILCIRNILLLHGRTHDVDAEVRVEVDLI